MTAPEPSTPFHSIDLFREMATAARAALTRIQSEPGENRAKVRAQGELAGIDGCTSLFAAALTDVTLLDNLMAQLAEHRTATFGKAVL